LVHEAKTVLASSFVSRYRVVVWALVAIEVALGVASLVLLNGFETEFSPRRSYPVAFLLMAVLLLIDLGRYRLVNRRLGLSVTFVGVASRILFATGAVARALFLVLR
jgi:hypothetical protein